MGRRCPIKHIFRCTGDLWTGTFVELTLEERLCFVSDLLREAKANELDEPLSTTRLNHLIDKGYERITLQLDLGENPRVIWKKINITEKPMRLYLMLFILQILQR